MDAVNELQRIGFDVWVASGKIRYRQVTEGPVNTDWVNNLLQDIKKHKREVINYLQNPQPQKKDPACPADDSEAGTTDSQTDQVTDDAELLSGRLQYLAGIGEQDLTGWKLWRRIEQGKEHRFATDETGEVRWERADQVKPWTIADLFVNCPTCRAFILWQKLKNRSSFQIPCRTCQVHKCDDGGPHEWEDGVCTKCWKSKGCVDAN